MNKNKLYLKIIAIAIIASIFVQSAYLGLPFLSNGPDNNIYAYNTISIPVTNGNFENPTFTGSVSNPNNWTVFNADENTINGIIDVSNSMFSEYSDDYGLSFNPGKDEGASTIEHQILMINSQDNQSQTGYTSSNIFLDKHGFYAIEFYAYTQSDSVISESSAYLKGDNYFIENSNTSFKNIDTAGEWQKFVFYIQTSKFNPLNLNLDVMLGSKDDKSEGAVFFNDVRIYAYSNSDYITLTNTNEGSPNHKTINLSEQDIPFFIPNQDFESGFLNDVIGWERLSANETDLDNDQLINGIYYVDSNFDPIATGVENAPSTPNIYNSSKALLINNKLPASVGFKSSDFIIERQRLYKLSVFIKTSSNSPGAQIRINQQNPYGEEDIYFSPAEEAFKNIVTTTSSNDIHNDWNKYTFYINGHHYYNTYANIELWLGDDNVSASGHAFFNNLSLTMMETEDYDGIETGTRSKIADFSTAFKTDNYNGNFNEVYYNYDENEPFLPKRWSINSLSPNYSESDILNGVINTNTSIFDNYNFTEITNPSNFWELDDDEIYNNILMLGNSSTTSQFAQSNQYFLEAEKYYKLDFYVQTQNLSDPNVFISVSNAESTLIKVDNIQSEYEWTKHTLYIKTTDRDESGVRIKLHLGSDDYQVSGYAFFDNVRITSTTEEKYEESITKINLNSDNFNTHSPLAVSGLYTPLNFDSSKQKGEHILAGVIDTDNFDLVSNYFPELDNPLSASPDHSKVLMINNNVDDFYILDRIRSYKLLSNEYYKISIHVKTMDLSSDQSNDYGAFISLNKAGSDFTGINTQINEQDNNYIKYSYYIKNDYDSFYTLSLGLGNEDSLTSGYAFFSNVLVEKITVSEFNENESETSDNIIMLGEISDIYDSEPIDIEDPAEDGFFINFDFLLLPSLILGSAILFVVLAYSLRKINLRKLLRKRRKKPNYDRKKSLNLTHRKKELIKIKKDEIIKLENLIKEKDSILKELDIDKIKEPNTNSLINHKKISLELKKYSSSLDNKTKQLKKLETSLYKERITKKKLIEKLKRIFKK